MWRETSSSPTRRPDTPRWAAPSPGGKCCSVPGTAPPTPTWR
jgi:hypothetical protein